MKRIAYFATKLIGYRCFEILLDNCKKLNCEVVAVLTGENNKLDDPRNSIQKLAADNGIAVYENLNDLLQLDIDIIISVQYHKILKQKHIDAAKQIAVNLHMAPLPEYRGCNQFSFAILDDASTFGTTIHQIETSVDGGDILFEIRFPIPENCWVKQLYDLTFQKSVELFQQSLPKIVNGDYNPISQSSFKDRKSSFHLRNEIEQIKQLSLNWEEEKIYKHIRATYFPPFKPPYFLIKENKIYIRLDNCN